MKADWFRRLVQALEYSAGFELFLLLGPGEIGERVLSRLALSLERFGEPRWHPLHQEGIDALLTSEEPGVLHLVYGLEHMPRPAARELLARLNLNRDRLRELASPVLFWVPETLYEELLAQAIDLFAWRSQVDVVSITDLEADDTSSDLEAPSMHPLEAGDQPPRVLIGYSHESAQHNARVLALAQQLRSDGIDAWLDLFEPTPPQGWPAWVHEQVERADVLLLVCTPTFSLRFDGRDAAAREMFQEGELQSYLLDKGFEVQAPAS